MRPKTLCNSFNVLFLAAAAALVLALTGCDRLKPTPSAAPAPTVAPQNPAWSQIIASHTAGIVSRKATIRVMFASDVVEAARVGTSAGANLASDPGIAGNATFTSAREIVLSPQKELESGRFYRFTVKPNGLLGLSDTLAPYEFVAQVQPRQFEVNVAGLSSDPKNESQSLLKGSLITADTEAPEQVEKMLSASFLDKALPLTWQHQADGRNREFTVAGIERQAEAASVVLKWDGKAIGSATKGERTVEVPARNQFKVAQVQAVQTGGEQYVQVFFSDALDPKQNLRGLVRLSSGGSTERIEGNILKIYPEKGVEGDVSVTLDVGIRNTKGDKLAAVSLHTVAFASAKPQVRFVGKGVILPDNPVLSVPFEAVNVRSVHVTALRIYENNVGQFLQVNKLDGQQDLGRVGRYLWRKKIHLNAPQPNRWNRYALDVTELFQKHPGGLFRLVVSVNRADSTYECPGAAADATLAEPPIANEEDFNQREASSWDSAEEYFGADGREEWNQRENPCSNAYFRFAPAVRDARNFLASNIGMVAKRDQTGRLLIATTDLRTAKVMKGVKLTAMNYQNQPIDTVTTDGDGLARFKPSGTPFYLLADKDGQKGYLKVSQGTALPVSHFDVGGEKVSAGIKGHLYGERGVWRPGDDIFMTFVLQDTGKTLPANHPVTLELRNPKGQLVQTLTNAAPVGSFYKFTLKTSNDAPTGDWTAKALLGGAQFSRVVKVETIMPNRLKIELDVGKGKLSGSTPLRGKLSAQWLTGATASGLKADVQMRLVKAPTRFERFTDFIFDDPARDFAVEPVTVFEGQLDASGKATFAHEDAPAKEAPGMLTAALTTRVFEPGGAFSINRQSAPFSPYDRYVGIKLPKGDVARNMLLTDKAHTVEVATVSSEGKPVAGKNLEVTLYKVEWKWWWDKTGESLAQYVSAQHANVVKKDKITTTNGQATWNFEIKYPQWGRYLVRACDLDGGHCTGQTFYIDWPAWAGRAQEQGGPGASVLTFNADRQQYTVGEKAVVQLPEASQGRALMTVENGTGIVEARWIELEKGKTRFEVPITKAMSPNVYVSVTLIQPHAEKKNDRPIRLYGVIPLMVSDPETKLKPVLAAPAEWLPEAKVSVEVSEAGGREMTYTVAVVDEGLLGLTNFKTPELHEQFYKREALGVATWDLFDEVAGAYGGELERLLALGGSDAGDVKDVKEDKKRFPPVVKYLGPFKLKAGAKAKHEFQLPPYVGAVRAMLVAGEAGAYGSAEKSVFVRQPLMLLPTLPRLVGPEEEVTVPVSIFVMEPGIKEVTLKLEADSQFQLVGADTVKVNFAQPEEKLGLLRIKSAARLGKGKLKFTATSGAHRATAEVFLEVRSPNPLTTHFQRKTLQPGEAWEANVVPHGLLGTNVVTMEVSAVPPLDLERRLHYLVQYPHGCLEQITSAAFPQLYLPSLMKLEDARKKEIESHMHAAIDKLRGFQQANGAFSYWPGGFGVSQFDTRSAWSTNYAGHFLLEAGKLGYNVPGSMRSDFLRFQKEAAQAWTAGNATPVLDQAYRLYTLALAGQPEVGAMNRLREVRMPSTARWMLAAAYKLAGLGDAANDIVKADRIEFAEDAMPDATFGSRLRDSAIVLHSMLLLGQADKVKSLVDDVSGQLASESWHSTQSVAYALMAMAKFAGSGKVSDYTYERSVAGKTEKAKAGVPIDTTVLKDFPAQGAPVGMKNTSDRTLFATVVVRGIPKAGDDEAGASGLAIEVDYRGGDGGAIELAKLAQGQDVVADITVKNTTPHRIENIALTQMVAAGYEIHNERMEGAPTEGKRSEPKRRGFFFFDGTPAATSAQVEHLDIRDDRVNRYFALNPGESISFKTRLTAAYLGRFYLPSMQAEAMYDATKNARIKGRWVEVVPAGK
jgi:alpha-2-macroglobulin